MTSIFLVFYKAMNRLHLGIWSKVLHFKAMHPALLSLECLVQLPLRISHYIPAICGVGWKWLTHFGEHATDSQWLVDSRFQPPADQKIDPVTSAIFSKAFTAFLGKGGFIEVVTWQPVLSNRCGSSATFCQLQYETRWTTHRGAINQ